MCFKSWHICNITLIILLWHRRLNLSNQNGQGSLGAYGYYLFNLMTIVLVVRIAVHIIGIMSLSSAYCWPIITVFLDYPSDKHVNNKISPKFDWLESCWIYPISLGGILILTSSRGKKWKEKRKFHLCTQTLFAKT